LATFRTTEEKTRCCDVSTHKVQKTTVLVTVTFRGNEAPLTAYDVSPHQSVTCGIHEIGPVFRNTKGERAMVGGGEIIYRESHGGGNNAWFDVGRRWIKADSLDRVLK
jgi:hypothetical protein